MAFAEDRLGEMVREPRKSPGDLTIFRQFSEADGGWWRPEHEYARYKAGTGHPLAPRYLDNNRTLLRPRIANSSLGFRIFFNKPAAKEKGARNVRIQHLAKR